MEQSWVGKVGYFVVMLCLFVVFQMGCPAKTVTPDAGTDGGVVTPDQPPTLTGCEAGSACLQVTTKGVRACDFLLTNDVAIASPNVAFDKDIIGETQFKGNRMALSWTVKPNADPASNRFIGSIKLPAGVKAIKLTKAVCYDAKGTKIDKPEVTLQIP